MRTTLTLDDDLARQLRELAHETGRSFKRVVNETLRAGLIRSGRPNGPAYELHTVALGGTRPGVDLDQALRLADEIEDGEIVREMDSRK